MKVFVAGHRYYGDWLQMQAVLDAIHAATPITLIGHGACHLGGADLLAERWARLNEVDYRGYPAKFRTGSLGKQEGPIRNRRALRAEQWELIVAFPGGRGTADLLQAAKECGYLPEQIRRVE